MFYAHLYTIILFDPFHSSIHSFSCSFIDSFIYKSIHSSNKRRRMRNRLTYNVVIFQLRNTHFHHGQQICIIVHLCAVVMLKISYIRIAHAGESVQVLILFVQCHVQEHTATSYTAVRNSNHLMVTQTILLSLLA